MMIFISPTISVNESELEFSFIRSPGPGGQNVNKLATAVQLRFDVVHSPSLPEDVRSRLLSLLGKKITTHGEYIIKASRYRTQDRNKQDALDRLIALLKKAAQKPRKRKKTKPTAASVEKRLTQKKVQAKKKLFRQKKYSES